MVQREVNVRSRIVGADLRRRREEAGLDAVQLAHCLNWSPTKISHIEHGNRAISEMDAAMYLSFCRTKGEAIKEVLRFFHDHDDHWVQPHGAKLSDDLRALTILETTTAIAVSFEQTLIPGLLQTPEYTRNLFRSAGAMPAEHVEPLAKARHARQAVLHRGPSSVRTFFIHEHALRMEVGGPRVMNDQLLHLVFTSSMPNISIRVIPASAGPHAGLDGPFSIMVDRRHRPAVYIETAAASLFINRDETVALYRDIESRLSDVALDEERSRVWLAGQASEFDLRTPAPEGDESVA